MLRKIYLLTAAVLIVTGYTAFAQSGAIKGKVMDKATKEPLPFANVIVEINGSQAGGAQTDFDGNFTIKPLVPGNYNLKASFVGYAGVEVTGVLVSTDKITFQDLMMTKGAVDITAVEVTSYKNPIIDKGNPSTQTTVTQEEIKVAPTRDVKSVAATTAGVFQKDEGDDVNVRGSRTDATDYYIDGIKVRGSTAIPQSGIEQITVVTGGVPAQYGDATGGIINITTRGPSQEFFGGIEFVTSELFDKYGYNLIGANLSGPIWSKKNNEGKVDRTIVGFFLSGEYQLEKDPDPSAIGFYKVKDDVYNDLIKNPLSPNLQQGGSVYRNKSEYLTNNDFEEIKAKQNVGSKGYRISGKIDIQPLENVTLTFGGSYDHSNKNEFIYTYALYNFDNNNQRLNDTWRVFGRITQKLGGATSSTEGSASVIKNAYYSIQVDYNREKTILQDEDHEDRYFDYGYLGKFDVIKSQGLTFDSPAITFDPVTGEIDTAFTAFNPVTGEGIFYEQNNPPSDSIVFFNPGGINSITEAYTSQYYQLVGENYVGNYQNLAQIATNGGLVNGSLPRNTYSLWRSPGYTYNQYRNTQSTQFRVSAQVSADIKDHAISAGFEYEQRSDAEFVINPVGLWGLMRLRANEKNRQLDYSDTTFVGNAMFFDRKYDGDGTISFFENLREKLASAGYSNVSNTDFVNIAGIDPDL
nr:TonB-dependent receptor [Bacteroidia bacterium]